MDESIFAFFFFLMAFLSFWRRARGWLARGASIWKHPPFWIMTCCKTSVRFDINFTFSTEHRLTFTLAIVVVVVLVVAVDVAAFLLNQSLRYTSSKEHIYTHDTAQG
jgi:hypothetical protein